MWFAASTKQAMATTSSFGSEDKLVFDTVDGSDVAVSEFLFLFLIQRVHLFYFILQK
jgi:hypothetical protein